MSGYDYLSSVTACTTPVSGRFTVRGQSFELITDGSVASGGPGRAPGPLDLMVSALVTNMLNVLHHPAESESESESESDSESDPDQDQTVHVRARTTRYSPDRLKVGLLSIEVMIDGLGKPETEALLEHYRRGCLVLPAVETVLDVRIAAVSAGDVAA